MKNALHRELLRIRSNSRHLIAAIAIPLVSLLFMATIFGNGKIENLPTGIVDNCNTPLSREIIRKADASPVLDISPRHIYSNQAEAKQAMQNMEIFGYMVIDLPDITCHYHYALLAAGGEMEGAFVKVLADVSASLVEEYGNYAGLTSVQSEAVTYPTKGTFASTYNSTLDYGTFLSYPFFFIFFQIFILVFTVYIIGTDMKREWMESAGGNPFKAVAGKLIPYAAIFMAQTTFANWIFFCVAGIPLHGSLTAINASSLLFVVSTISLGAAIAALIPKVSIAISVASMIGALGATASGVTFPIENMYPFFRGMCHLFPVRHFVLANQSILYNNAQFPTGWDNYAALLAITAICICTIPLIKRAIRKDAGKPLPIMWGVSLVILGGTVGYGFLYGLMYHPNIVTEVPVAVVDNSHTPTSRSYIQNLDATQGIHIYAQCPNLHSAQELMQSAKVKGIVFIPPQFAALASQGKEAYYTVIETTTSFLYYLTIQKAAAATMQEINNTLRPQVVKSLLLEQQPVMAQTPSLNINTVADYNSNNGYGSYLLPIAIIVILFQTMLMSCGILAGSGTIHPFKYLPLLVTGYLLLSIFLTALIPQIFSLPALANPAELFIFLFLFILATAAFSGCVTLLFKDPEEVMLYVPFFSVGLIFLSGTSFPMVQIPHFWQIAHYLFPTSPAIVGYIKLNSMGGSLHNAAPQIILLLVQLLIYGSIFLLHTRKIVNLHKQNHGNNGKMRINR